MTYLLFVYHKNIIYCISCRFNGDETLQIITFVFFPLKAIRVYTARIILVFYLRKASSVFRIRLTISWNFVLLRTNIKEVFFQKLRWSKPSEVCFFKIQLFILQKVRRYFSMVKIEIPSTGSWFLIISYKAGMNFFLSNKVFPSIASNFLAWNSKSASFQIIAVSRLEIL